MYEWMSMSINFMSMIDEYEYAWMSMEKAYPNLV